jgi:DNA polymerase (family 10)
MKNQELADIFNRIADILEYRGDLVFKINAYRRAARAIEGLSQDIAQLAQSDRLETIPGIGRAIAEKIREYLATGRMAKYEEVSASVPRELIDLLQIQSLGPKTLALLHRRLGVKDLDSLIEALDSGQVEKLPGLGAKKVENLRQGIKHYRQGRERMFLGRAYPLAASIVSQLKERLKTQRVAAAGSLRRMRETIGDIDILVCHRDGPRAIDAFLSLPLAARILGRGETKASILTDEGLQVDLRVVPERSYGAALQYFTGSKEHNVRLREMARKQGLTISEYGIFKIKGNRYLGGQEEADIYRRLGLPWIPPELREDRGEIQAALENRLPRLVELNDIRGDLHVHSDWSDGHSTIEELAQAAEDRGYRYLAICDHSTSASYAGGLSPEKLQKQMAYIERFNVKNKTRKLRVLTGVECDIKPDGTLDLPDDLLRKLDIVVASIHSAFTQNVTARMISACRHPLVDIIGHPTGRLISKRDGYQGLDLEAVMRQAAATGTALEINSYFERLDLNDLQAKRAVELGCRLAINTDSHRVQDLWMMELGVGTARRAWLTPKDILNCSDMKKLLSKRERKK